jgi:F0F1-type ATP synthase membrane subunit c/vacuolar-type H+-ATPase subunit K
LTSEEQKQTTKRNMKKLAFTIICGLAVTGAAFAQGTVIWNAFTSAITWQTNSAISPLFSRYGGIGGTQANAATGSAYYYELLYNTAIISGPTPVAPPDAATLFGGTWLDAKLGATNQAAVNGRLQPMGNSTAATVPWSNGTTNNIMLVGWSSSLGTSWAGVSNILAAYINNNYGPLIAQVGTAMAFFGESSTGYINPGTANPGVTLFTSVAGNTGAGLPITSLNTPLYVLPDTYVPPVPEPGTMVLVGLGGLSLLLFRRRK